MVRRRRIRLGIVGCGAVAQVCHLKALYTLPQFEVTILCDRDVKTAQKARSMYGLRSRVTDKIEDMAGQVDAAIVCVWPGAHLPVTRQLLDIGLDVLCEKPVATNSADAREIVALAERADRIVAVGHWCRCQRSVWILRRLMSLGFFGDIQSVTAEFGNVLDWPMTSGAYFDRNVTAGGVLFEAGIHVVDLVVWLFGALQDIEFEDDSYGGVESNAVIHGTLQIDGRPVPCQIGASWTHDLDNGVRLVGSKGEAQVMFPLRNELIVRQPVGNEQLDMRIPQGDMRVPFESSDPYAAQLEDFAVAIRTRRPPITPVASTVLPLEIIEAAYARRRPMPQPWVEAGLGSSCHTPGS